jgi:hypothetical protein
MDASEGEITGTSTRVYITYLAGDIPVSLSTCLLMCRKTIRRNPFPIIRLERLGLSQLSNDLPEDKSPLAQDGRCLSES